MNKVMAAFCVERIEEEIEKAKNDPNSPIFKEVKLTEKIKWDGKDGVIFKMKFGPTVLRKIEDFL